MTLFRRLAWLCVAVDGRVRASPKPSCLLLHVVSGCYPSLLIFVRIASDLKLIVGGDLEEEDVMSLMDEFDLNKDGSIDFE